jgi:heat shock protein HslJ
MGQEQRFLDALVAATSYEYDVLQNWIELFDATGQLRMTLGEVGERPPMGLPAWSTWVLTDINGQPVDTKPKITMLFSNGLLGDAGCLSYSAYIITRPNGEVPYLHGSYPYSPMDWYDGDCGSAGPSPEALAYRAALEGVTHYRLSSDRFEFLNADGVVVFGYAPSLTEGTGLEDTSWTLLSLNGMSVIEGTEISLTFEYGGMNGVSGCNYYGSQYIIPEERVISLHDTVMTAMLCPDDPVGLMEQETAFHEILSDIGAYRVSETQLQLLNADGVVLLVFERAEP